MKFRGRAKREDSEKGAVIPIVALSLTFLMAATALSVDIGRLAARTRDLQSVADLAALDGARLLDGRSELALYPAVESAVADSADRNDFAGGLAVDLGCFDRPTSTWDTGCARPDSVRVTATDDVPFYFQAGTKTTSRTGTAQRDPWVDFSIGSLEAGIDPDLSSPITVTRKVEILNVVIDAFFEVGLPDVVDVNIDLVGYQGLAAADILLGDLAAELGFGSPDEMLASEVSAEDVVVAMVDILDAQGNTAAAEALDSFATDIDNNTELDLGELFELSSGNGSAADASVSALDLLVGGAQVVNGVNFVDTAFTGAIGPVQISNLDLVVVENPVRVPQARVGDVARTSQMRASMVLEIPLDLGLAGLLPPVEPLPVPTDPLPLEPLPPPPTLPTVVRLPIVVEMAAAKAEITGITCKEPFIDSETAMRVFTDAFRIQIGEVTDLATFDPLVTPAELFSGVTGGASLNLADHVEDIDPPFIGPYNDDNTRRVYGHGAPAVMDELLAKLTTSLGSDLTAQLQAALAGVLPDLDTELFGPLFEIGGVGLGGADVTAHRLECLTPKLVD